MPSIPGRPCRRRRWRCTPTGSRRRPVGTRPWRRRSRPDRHRPWRPAPPRRRSAHGRRTAPSGSLGAAVFCSRYLFHFAGIDPSLILLGFVFLVALGIDYNVFLTARARQEAAAGPGAGMRKALTATGGVIPSAGLVLAGTFTVLGVLP